MVRKQEQERKYENILILSLFVEWKTPGAQIKAFSPFSSLRFLLEALPYFKKSTKENSLGAEMDNLHIEDLMERSEREREGGGSYLKII